MTWLLTWLWEGLLLTMVVDLLIRLQRGLAPAARYAIWLVVLGAVATTPLLHLVTLGSTWMLRSAGSIAPPVATPDPRLQIAVPVAPAWILGVIACSWALLTAWRLARIVRACVLVGRLKRRARPMPENVARRLPGWAAARIRLDRRLVRVGLGRDVSLCCSDEVSNPVALGLGRGMILVPSSLVRRLEPEELDQIVLHELAHVRRWDDWTRLAQSLLQAVAAIHPAAWWCGRHLDLEREAACDRFAVRGAATPRTYARSLTKVAWLAGTDRPFADVATGATRGGRELAVRVRRLLEAKRGWPPGLSAASAACTLSVAAAMVGVAGAEVALITRGPASGVAPPGILLSTLPARQWHDLAPLVEVVARSVEIGDPARVQPDARRLSAPIEVTTLPVRRQSGPQPTTIRARSAGPAAVSAALPLEAINVDYQFEAPGATTLSTLAVPPAAADRGPWLAVADAGTGVGSSVKDAGLATARAFSRFGRSVASAF